MEVRRIECNLESVAAILVLHTNGHRAGAEAVSKAPISQFDHTGAIQNHLGVDLSAPAIFTIAIELDDACIADGGVVDRSRWIQIPPAPRNDVVRVLRGREGRTGERGIFERRTEADKSVRADVERSVLLAVELEREPDRDRIGV